MKNLPENYKIEEKLFRAKIQIWELVWFFRKFFN